MMSSDGNKKEEKGEEVIILCSSRTSRFRRLDETKIHPKFIRETTVSPVLSTSNVRRNSSSSPVPSVRRIKRCPISDKAISANDQRTRPRYYRIPENQSLSMLELHRYGTALLHGFALIPVFFQADVPILCEDCNGIGWLLCDFCKGQKMNVKSETNRIYGRCPSCRTVSFELLLTIESPITSCFRGLIFMDIKCSWENGGRERIKFCIYQRLCTYSMHFCNWNHLFVVPHDRKSLLKNGSVFVFRIENNDFS
ncbi:hypothetical protein DVH24_033263 [Malus domestica]|uniref:Uncharacterized protein n=1 Tax=Malus domestica TaxID=3750 RepID=A0A498JC49_MALDO|nr:hypothetical protein DVH24_033263 [Malus domestica]